MLLWIFQQVHGHLYMRQQAEQYEPTNMETMVVIIWLSLMMMAHTLITVICKVVHHTAQEVVLMPEILLDMQERQELLQVIICILNGHGMIRIVNTAVKGMYIRALIQAQVYILILMQIPQQQQPTTIIMEHILHMQLIRTAHWL